MGFEEGEYGDIVNGIQRKFTCPVFPVCRSMFDSEKEAFQHFLDEHDYSELDKTDA
jgi:hypothetical protein